MDIGEIKKEFSDSFQADPAAQKRIKGEYLRSFNLKFPQVRPASSFLRLAGLTAAILVLINSTAIVYAEKNEVSPSHPLYGYKRLSENIQTAVSSPGQKAHLQKKFAARRLKEIEEVKKNGMLVMIDKLEKDFKKEVHTALEAKTADRSNFCKEVKGLIKKHKELTGKNERWEKFRKACNQDPD